MNHAGYSKQWYRNAPYLQSWYRGIPIVKHPNDLFAYQEIIFQTRPDLIIETGTYAGGSAVFLADQLDLMAMHSGLPDKARVLTIDIRANQEFLDGLPEHPRVSYMYGYPSTDLRVIEEVEKRVAKHDRVMVILDSDHRKANVLREMNLYSKFVTDGCYLIVEDTNHDAYDALDAHYDKADGYAGHAVSEWRPQKHGFSVDDRRERWLFTQNPGGYLKKGAVSAGG